MIRRATYLAAAALLALGPLPACTETVAFLPLELEVQERVPPIQAKCDKDPRRIKQVTIRAVCGHETVEETFSSAAGAVSLSGLPLGECRVEVEGYNAHGRMVMSGAEGATISEGDNATLKVKLLEEKCTGSCDSDSDGLADRDEKKLGTYPDQPDSDGDGLDDGLELTHCCSDPKVVDGQGCKLLIQRVDPPLAPPGDWVLIKTTTTLTNPKVTLGGAPLVSPLKDSATVFGQVAKPAVLGDLRLATASGEKTTYGALFPVLLQDTETVFELEQKAGAKIGRMQEVVDIRHAGTLLMVLGRSGTVNGVRLPVLMFIDRAKGTYTRIPLPNLGAPVATAVAKGRFGVLLGAGSTKAVLLGYEVNSSGKVIKGTTIGVDAPYPVDAILEPSGDAALVLSRDRLTRVDLTGKATKHTLPISLQAANALPGAPAYQTRCTGLTYHEPLGTKPGQGTAYMACQAKRPCPAGQKCNNWIALVALSPAASCLARTTSTTGQAGCWTVYPTAATAVTAGAPLVDPVWQRVYMLTGAGALAGVLAGPTPKVAFRALGPLLSFKLQGISHGLRVMALDARRQLYVSDGPIVRRLDLAKATPGKVPQRPFPVGRFQETARNLSIASDSSLLEVARMQGGALHSLAGVCLKRCPACLCK